MLRFLHVEINMDGKFCLKFGNELVGIIFSSLLVLQPQPMKERYAFDSDTIILDANTGTH